MDFLTWLMTATPDGGPGGIELLVVMVPALIVICRSCRQLVLESRNDKVRG
jgi:hypothetical protein